MTDAAAVTVPLSIDARRIVAEVFPDLSLRTWRRMDAAGKCPRGHRCGGRKLWHMRELDRWAQWGFPGRKVFEVRLDAERHN